MKKILSILFVLMVGASLAFSCKDDDPSGTIFVDPQPGTEIVNDFDLWLKDIYQYPFNIIFNYKYLDRETDLNYYLVPAKYEESIKIARLLRLLWLDPYLKTLDEFEDAPVEAGLNFIRKVSPKLIMPLGTAAINNNGTRILGQASLGLKILLFEVNDLSGYLSDLDNPDNVYAMNEYYFKTMHHEFAHILHQNIDIPEEFKEISRGEYLQDVWYDPVYVPQARPNGFITPYARSGEYEDFVEVLANWVVYDDAQWAIFKQEAGTNGWPIIQMKLDIVKDWIKTNWYYDLDTLRGHVLDAYDKIQYLDMDSMDPEVWDRDIY